MPFLPRFLLGVDLVATVLPSACRSRTLLGSGFCCCPCLCSLLEPHVTQGLTRCAYAASHAAMLVDLQNFREQLSSLLGQLLRFPVPSPRCTPLLCVPSAVLRFQGPARPPPLRASRARVTCDVTRCVACLAECYHTARLQSHYNRNAKTRWHFALRNLAFDLEASFFCDQATCLVGWAQAGACCSLAGPLCLPSLEERLGSDCLTAAFRTLLADVICEPERPPQPVAAGKELAAMSCAAEPEKPEVGARCVHVLGSNFLVLPLSFKRKTCALIQPSTWSRLAKARCKA